MDGRVDNPGIFVISPAKGTTKPAPADNKMSFMTNLNPVGAPFIAASPVREFDVLAMQIGSLSYP